jgi:hypothetical protein
LEREELKVPLSELKLALLLELEALLLEWDAFSLEPEPDALLLEPELNAPLLEPKLVFLLETEPKLPCWSRGSRSWRPPWSGQWGRIRLYGRLLW